MTCKEATQLVSESLDKELPLYKRLALQAHFRICVFCERYGRQLLFLRETFQEYSRKVGDEESPSHSLSPESRERLKRKLREQSQDPDEP